MQAAVRSLATICMLLSSFMAQAEDTWEPGVIDTDEGKYVTTVQENDRGRFLDIIPAEKDDKSISRRVPSDCPECGLECLMPSLVRFESGLNPTELGAGVVTLTVENPSRCIRIDGFRRKRDSLIQILVTNRREEKYQAGVLESGEVLFKGDVLPGAEIGEQLAPSGDRRYTFWISAYPNQAKERPTHVGFAVYRFENDTDPIQSLVMLNLGAGQ